MSHLTAADRGRIETLLQEKYTNKQIGIKLTKHAINTLHERVSSLVAFTKLTHKTAAQTADAIIAKLCLYVALTITFDNGSEFTLHEQITAAWVSKFTSPIPTAPGSVGLTRIVTANSEPTYLNDLTYEI